MKNKKPIKGKLVPVVFILVLLVLFSATLIKASFIHSVYTTFFPHKEDIKIAWQPVSDEDMAICASTLTIPKVGRLHLAEDVKIYSLTMTSYGYKKWMPTGKYAYTLYWYIQPFRGSLTYTVFLFNETNNREYTKEYKVHDKESADSIHGRRGFAHLELEGNYSTLRIKYGDKTFDSPIKEIS